MGWKRNRIENVEFNNRSSAEYGSRQMAGDYEDDETVELSRDEAIKAGRNQARETYSSPRQLGRDRSGRPFNR